jgi:hypothetical protein
MEFLNIIFCSLPANWCIEDVAWGGWFVSCSHKSRTYDGSGKVCALVSATAQTYGAFFAGVICDSTSLLCFRFL